MADEKLNDVGTTRKEAKDKGLTFYYTSKPCLRGHFSKRHTSSGKCVECSDIYQKEWRRKNSSYQREYHRKWRTKNKDRKREADRRWRINNSEIIKTKGRESRKKKREERLNDKLSAFDKNTRDKIIYWGEAKKRGLKFYFTGLPCSAGHVTQRIVSSSECRQCAKEKGAKRHAENREEANKRSRDRYWGRAREHDLAYAKRHYYANHEVHLERSKKWSKENPEKARVTRKKSYAKNREKYRAANKRWMANNPEARRVIKRNREARKRGNGGTHTAEDIYDIRRMQKDRCAMPTCRIKLHGGGHVDHIIPLAKGGTNDRRNIQLLCPACNLSKHARDPIDHARSLGMLL